MKFTKFGKTLLMSAFSAGIVLSLTSCVQSYTVGYLYVTGTVTSGSGDNGIVSGFKIDHNTGKLTPIDGLPVSSGGSNPVRAVLLGNSRYLYVLNRGLSTNSEGTGDCTSAYPCAGSIELFAIGANGVLTPQENYSLPGSNQFRMIADSTGTYLYVLEHDSPDNSAPSSGDGCSQVLGNSQTTCGGILAYMVNSTTGYLTPIVNQSQSVNSTNLTYFPVPNNSVDFALSGYYVFTLYDFNTSPADYPYSGGTMVFPYNYNSTNGQLTTTETPYPGDQLTDSNPNGTPSGTAIVSAGGYIYVLDNNPFYNADGEVTSQSQILPYTIGTYGGLAAVSSGNIADDQDQADPIYLTLESKGKWFYVANQGSTNTSNSTSSTGITGYDVNTPYDPGKMSGTPINFGSGSGPQCLVEDPSDQYFYTANINDSSVTGQVIDQNSGTLTPLSQSTKVPSEYTLTGPPTWCLVDGHTD